MTELDDLDDLETPLGASQLSRYAKRRLAGAKRDAMSRDKVPKWLKSLRASKGARHRWSTDGQAALRKGKPK